MTLYHYHFSSSTIISYLLFDIFVFSDHYQLLFFCGRVFLWLPWCVICYGPILQFSKNNKTFVLMVGALKLTSQLCFVRSKDNSLHDIIAIFKLMIMWHTIKGHKVYSDLIDFNFKALFWFLSSFFQELTENKWDVVYHCHISSVKTW